METLAFLAVVLVALASTAVGARLLLVSRRTRGFPEFVLGLSLAAITGIGFPIVLLTELRQTIGPLLTFSADLIGSFVVAMGFAGFYVFTWRVFRSDSRWAAALTMLGSGAALVATVVTVWLAVGVESSEEKFRAVRGWEILLFTSAAAGFLWSAIEAFRYHAMLRRRLALGLTDAVVTNRFLLWGLTGCLGRRRPGDPHPAAPGGHQLHERSGRAVYCGRLRTAGQRLPVPGLPASGRLSALAGAKLSERGRC